MQKLTKEENSWTGVTHLCKGAESGGGYGLCVERGRHGIWTPLPEACSRPPICAPASAPPAAILSVLVCSEVCSVSSASPCSSSGGLFGALRPTLKACHPGI